MSALRFQHGILLATIVLIFPVPCHLGVQEHDIEEDIKREITDRLNNFVLQQLAKEKQKENRIQYEESHIKEAMFSVSRLYAHLRSTSIGPIPVRTLRLTLSAPSQTSPPETVQMCIKTKCFTVNGRPSLLALSHQLENTQVWLYTLSLNETVRLPVDVHIRLDKALRIPLASPPTLEAITRRAGSRDGHVRATVRVLRSGHRSRRSATPQEWQAGSCKLHQWVVSTADVGLDEHNSPYIVSPTNLTLGYCAGQCVDSTPMSHNAKVRRHHRLLHADSTVPPPVCVPIRYQHQQVYLQGGSSINGHLFKKFAAVQCACL